jgi:hypothetical protein
VHGIILPGVSNSRKIVRKLITDNIICIGYQLGARSAKPFPRTTVPHGGRNLKRYQISVGAVEQAFYRPGQENRTREREVDDAVERMGGRNPAAGVLRLVCQEWDTAYRSVIF